MKTVGRFVGRIVGIIVGAGGYSKGGGGEAVVYATFDSTIVTFDNTNFRFDQSKT